MARAVDAGATLVRQLKNEFYVDWTAMVADPFGYWWQIASRVENVSPGETQARWNKMMQSGSVSYVVMPRGIPKSSEVNGLRQS